MPRRVRREAREPFPPLLVPDLLAVALITAATLAALAPQLAHPAITNWDESVHQVVVRNMYDDPFSPHVYVDPLHPVRLEAFYEVSVFLSKPPLPFWLAAAFMRLGLGITPVALRLVSLLAQLLGALALYFWLRGAAGRFWALVGAVAFNGLPFTWRLTQGVFFGESTDCGVMGALALSFVTLQLAIERRSLKLGALAGAFSGAAILFKAPLGLPIIGVAGALWGLSLVRFVQGPRLRDLLAFIGAAAAVAVPWNLYAWSRWPEVQSAAFGIWFGHLKPVNAMSASIGWARPVDAIFNEIHMTELTPLPIVLPLLGGLGLLVRAIARREPVVVGLALWVFASWILLSTADAKVPAVLWGTMPALLSGIALLGSAAVRRPPVALMLAAALLLTPWAIAQPALTALRLAMPAALVQTRVVPGLVEGLVVSVAGLGAGLALAAFVRTNQGLRLAPGVLASAALVWALVVDASRAQAQTRDEKRADLYVSYTKEVGLALAPILPERSVVLLGVENEPPCCFEKQALMFWSGRMAYHHHDTRLTDFRGYHRYLVSPESQPYEPLPGVPPNAWMQAYDLERPRPDEAPLPAGVEPAAGQVGPMQVLGFAAGPIDARRDRWAFYVSSPAPAGLTIRFETEHGDESVHVEPEATLRARDKLANKRWFILPVVGPKRAAVKNVTVGQ